MIEVLVKVSGLVFKANFVILDVNRDTEAPIILAQPFLATLMVALKCMGSSRNTLCLTQGLYSSWPRG